MSFSTPELVVLLSKHAGKKELSRMARTSGFYFNTMVGHVWQEVRGIHNLFVLIPSAECSQKNRNCTKIVIPNLLEADLARFNFYVRCVRYLDILPHQSYSYQFSGWNNLMQYANKTTIMPNLQTIVYGCRKSNHETFIYWIIPLLSSSVLEIYTNPPKSCYQSKLSMAHARVLLEAISNQCPAISTLSLFPVLEFFRPYYGGDDLDENYDDDSSDEANPMDEPRSDNVESSNSISPGEAASDAYDASRLQTRPAPYYEYLKYAQSLRTLSTTVFMLDPDALKILGNLPHLESLRFHDQFCEDFDCFDSSTLSKDSFPALRTLFLSFLDMDCIRYIWHTGPLVSRLESVSIDLEGNRRGHSDDMQAVEFQLFLPTLCSQSPNVEELTIDFDAARAITVHYISANTLARLSALPLRKLDLRHIVFANIPSACQALAVCSTLVNLHVQDQQITYEDMLSFARITSLECLHVNVQWQNLDSVAGYLSLNSAVLSPTLRFLQCSNVPYFVVNEDSIRAMVMFLILTWPGLQEVSWVGTTTCGVGPGVLDPIYSLISAVIGQVKGILGTQLSDAMALRG
ncbi:hypothetical protein BDV93DRAFT_547632 [Ceratobasidium sp. AG-I]|nr:hypothetical protein BDV93DRAFT_547632 [Ceratobasidium sp. AG-I]